MEYDELTKEQIACMMNAIGYHSGKEGENVFYVYQRNFFAVEKENLLWEDLENKGIASKSNSIINSKETLYSLTDKGIHLLSKYCGIVLYSVDEYQNLPPDIDF